MCNLVPTLLQVLECSEVVLVNRATLGQPRERCVERAAVAVQNPLFILRVNAITVLVIPERVEAPEPAYDTVLEHFKRRQVKGQIGRARVGKEGSCHGPRP